MAESKAIKNWVTDDVRLGTGAFAVVTLLTHRHTGEQIAIKTFKDDRKDICQKEIELLKKCSHEHVVKLVPIPEDLKHLPARILCMECCKEGNLRKLLNQPQNCAGLQEPIIRKCLANIGSALEYIHGQSVIHRDLKPENIVMQKVDGQLIFKLIDFGCSAESDSKSLLTKLNVGTRDYAAPEMFNKYTFSVDYWSFGFICHEMITGFRPFLPHLTPMVWIEKVQYKADEVICVYEQLFNDEAKSHVFSEHLFPENQISRSLATKLELWLRLALRWDYRKRGYNRQNQLVIFSALRDILSMKILTIFDAVNYKMLNYEITDSTSIADIRNHLLKDAGIPVVEQIILLPSGSFVNDNGKAADVWDSSCEFAMLYVFTAGKTVKTLEPEEPLPVVVDMTENEKFLLPHRKRQRVYVAAIHFLQTQLNLCKMFYEAMAVRLFSLILTRDSLLFIESEAQREIHHCNAMWNLFCSSVLYNEKCYKNACDSRAIVGEPDFFANHKAKGESFKLSLQDLETRLYECTNALKQTQIFIDEARAFQQSEEIIKTLEKRLHEGHAIYKANFKNIPQELKDSLGNCTEIVTLIKEFLKIMESFLSDPGVVNAPKVHQSCNDEFTSIKLELEVLPGEIEKLNKNIEQAQLSLFKAVWSLKKPESNPVPPLSRSPSSSSRTSVLNSPLLGAPGPADPVLLTLLQAHRDLHQQVYDFMDNYTATYESLKSRHPELDEL